MSAAPMDQDGRDFLRQALADRAGAHRPAGEPWMIVLPAPSVAPWTLGAEGRRPCVLFASPDGVRITGWDVASVITAAGHDVERVRVEAERAHRATTICVHPALPRQASRPATWVGGLSFSPGACADAVWAAFPDTCFVAPRWTHRVIDGVSALVLLLGPDDGAIGVDRWIEEYTALVSTTSSHAHSLIRAGQVRPAAVDRRSWLEGTRAALEAIARGALRKVVLARHLDVALGRVEALDVGEVLDDLARRFPSCTRFLLSRGHGDFFGATPETLIARAGREVWSDAMAGTAHRGDEAALQRSPKDAREHALVVEEIVAKLRPCCETLSVPQAAGVRELANVTHLWTPIRGRLAEPVHVLDLVAALHPTAAVAGTPTHAAVAFLDRAEPAPRGWFAAPFGWFDATGDGHFVVALRSCIRHPGGIRLYAGAGIVPGSDPERELEETELKMRAVLDTLHAIANQPAERVG